MREDVPFWHGCVVALSWPWSASGTLLKSASAGAAVQQLRRIEAMIIVL